jgi:anti-sigma regulatory factor (Ser/Thr protein kinase)
MVHARGSAPRDLPASSRPDTSGRWQRLLRGQQSEVRQLRRWLAALLPDGPERDDLTSVAVELATNAIQHTASGQSGWFTVELACHGHVAWIAVTDEGGPGAPRPSDDPLSDCGRGLVIVQALAQSWGVRGDSRGRTVWAEVACPAAAPAQPDAFPDGFLSRAVRCWACTVTDG